jgi:hypothetical protein
MVCKQPAGDLLSDNWSLGWRTSRLQKLVNMAQTNDKARFARQLHTALLTQATRPNHTKLYTPQQHRLFTHGRVTLGSDAG